MNPYAFMRYPALPHRSVCGIVLLVSLAFVSKVACAHDVRDLKYGAILFEFHQQKYFESLVEYEYAMERGGIEHHGTYPELLKGGVSLSYGLDNQARDIFTRLIEGSAPEEVQNRAWFYLAKMQYLRGDIGQSASTMGYIHGSMPHDIDQEYRYLAALINVRMGYFDEAARISAGFDKDGAYAPYLYFNLGVAFGKAGDTARAIANLRKSADSAGSSALLDRLADRSNMAIAYLSAQENDFNAAYEHIRKVNTTGVYSNRALLGAGWASINEESYTDALAPLMLLQQRSMAVPEVQEAVLLLPHVYEKQGLMGRAANGFIDAYDRYTDALTQLDAARSSLGNAEILELFVRNMDTLLKESDWFGTAPSVSHNAVSPFLLDLISDHSFQSVLKDLRDLYAIRNNLNGWKRKSDDFKVILGARAAAPVAGRDRQIEALASRQQDLSDGLDALNQRAGLLEAEDRQRMQWLLADIRSDLNSSETLVQLLNGSTSGNSDSGAYAQLVDSNMVILERELAKTNTLIARVESVLLELIRAELDIHEQRLKYYRVQSHLAKARILDRSLATLDDREYSQTDMAPGMRATENSAARGDDDGTGVRHDP